MAATRKPTFAETMKLGWTPPARRSAAAGGGAGGQKLKPNGRNGAAARAAAVASTATVAPPELVKRREELSNRFAELQWDLGGIAYEMASRDHFRLDVLNKQAAELQQVDAELGQIELVLKLDEAGASGTCPSCGAMHARGAGFCWQCGHELTPSK